MDFAILRSHFWYRQTVPKMGPWKCFSFVLLLSCACGPKMGPPGGPIFGTVFRFIFWSFLYQGCRSATFWFQWNFVAYGDRKGNCSKSICWLLKLNPVVIFCLLQGSAFAVDFAILRSHFWYRQTVPKMGPWKCFSFVLLLSCACGPKMGPPGGPIFGTVFRFIFWSFLYQGCRSATFWFQWNFVAYGDRKGNCSKSIC